MTQGTTERCTCMCHDEKERCEQCCDGPVRELVEALRGLAWQVLISNAVDDEGHELKNLQALAEAERVLARYQKV